MLEGKARWTFVADGVKVDALRLDASGMKIHSVERVEPTRAPLEWSHDGSSLQIRLDASGPMAIEIAYTVSAPTGGMTFSLPTPGVDGRPPQGAEVHTQGQPQSNHRWFPVHDFPNIRVSTEVIADVPAGLAASSNGMLLAHTSEGGREQWHWLQEKPHVPYLVSLVVGSFQRTELPAPLSGVPMAVWTQPADASLVAGTYGRTDAMIDCFERRFGIPYPWDRYDQLVVRNFGSGGMENTSATTMHPGAVLDETALLEGDIDGLISHELCHQWTGDLVTCRSWEHIWLNEGWATYGSALWNECHEGSDAYYDSVLGDFGVARGDSGMTGKDPVRATAPMCTHNYASPGETFRREANPYPKGASILHMLRKKLGDELFFRGVDLYFDRFAQSLVETDDFRHCLEDVSRLSLEQFFDQWCDQPGCPRVKAASTYDAGSRLLTLTLSQGERAPGLAPFDLAVPVLIRTASSERTVVVALSAREGQRQVELDGPPTMIAVDPELHVLKVLEVDLPEPLLIEQALAGPNSASRRLAMRALAPKDTAPSRDALAAIARDPKARRSERIEAIESIASAGSPEGRVLTRALFDELVVPTLMASPTEAASMCDPRIRAALTEAIAVAPVTEALPRLARVAKDDRGYAPRARALEGLARLGSGDAPADREAIVQDPAVTQAIEAALAQRTPGERLRSAAVEACGNLGLVSMIAHIEELSTLGHADRMRPSAIAALGKLAALPAASSERPKVIATLVDYLDDPESRSREAAGEALASLKAPEALARLEAIEKAAHGDRFSDRASGWIKRIRQ